MWLCIWACRLILKGSLLAGGQDLTSVLSRLPVHTLSLTLSGSPCSCCLPSSLPKSPCVSLCNCFNMPHPPTCPYSKAGLLRFEDLGYMLVFSGYHIELPQAGCFQTIETNTLIVLEVKTLKSRCQHVHVPSEDFQDGILPCLFPASDSCWHPWLAVAASLQPLPLSSCGLLPSVCLCVLLILSGHLSHWVQGPA